jgi:uncharacterized membrane protein HdeD (DUF308 family)
MAIATPITAARKVANHLSALFLLQGISFILLGILVLIYPPFLFALVAATFIWTGITTIILSGRVRRLAREHPELLE